MPATRASKVKVEPYGPQHESAWDEFVASSAGANLLHSRRFLGYHGERFNDQSLVFFDPSGRICGVLPAAASPDTPSVVASHPGATYGGLVLSDRKFGLDAIELLGAARQFFAAAGFGRLLYKSVPPHFHRGIRQADLYALWRLGARLVRRDLWNVIDLAAPRSIEESRRRRLRKAREGSLRVTKEATREAYSEFHTVLVDCLARRHAVAPVHSLEEMLQLQALFPDRIALWMARDAEGVCLAGEWIFDLGVACHGQYGAATEEGRERSAQDLLIETIIRDSASRGARFFSFGTSTEDAGRTLNAGLFDYKASFGAGAVAHDFYELDLDGDGG